MKAWSEWLRHADAVVGVRELAQAKGHKYKGLQLKFLFRSPKISQKCSELVAMPPQLKLKCVPTKQE